MAELLEQLQAILGDPQAMGQIAAIAQTLSGPSTPEPSLDGESDHAPAEAAPPPDLGALLTDLDPRFLQTALVVLSEYSAQDDRKAALLSALRPFLKEDRAEKMEKAEKIARLSRVVRAAVRLLREGDSHV